MAPGPSAAGTELSRKAFLRGGALVVGFGLAGPCVARAAGAPVDPFASVGPPDATAVSSYVAIQADGTASIKTGRVELGQGSMTGLLLIAAEELDLELEQLVFVRHDTNLSPDTGGTYGSSSIAIAGMELRAACAAARQALLGLASAKLGVPVAGLTTSNGAVVSSAGRIGYGDLVGGRVLTASIPFPVLQAGQSPAKPVSEYELVGISRAPRLDIPAKVTGTYTYVQNIRVPGMLHARLVRPLGQGAYGDGTLAGIVSVDERSIAGIGDARVVRRGDLLAVVATQEYDAIQAAQTLRVVYREPPEISGSGDLFGQMRTLDTAGQAHARIQALQGDVDGALAASAHTLSASYAYHFQGHMPIGPTCAVADVGPSGALVLCNTQDAYVMRDKLAQILGLPTATVRVQYWEGAGTFGSGPSRYDAGEAAAVVSQLAGAPVRLQFMRWDEHGWDNYGPAILSDLRGAVDSSGNMTALEDDAFALPSLSTATDVTMQNIGFPYAVPAPGGGDAINSGSQYSVPNRRVIAKSLPAWNTFFKTAALRAPHCPQTCFASEQMVDELAHTAGMDPYEFRLQNVATAQVNDGFGQWGDVLTAVGKLSGWQPRLSASRRQEGTVATGRGIALGGFAASQAGVVAEIEVNRATGKIRATHLYAAQVAGFSVYLPGIENQMEGNLIMGTSRALCEEVAFNRRRSLALDWVSYPILRFQDAPRVSVRVVQRKDLASTGAGEPPVVPVPAAIANAFFDATGVRIRTAPMTPGRVRAVLRAAETA